MAFGPGEIVTGVCNQTDFAFDRIDLETRVERATFVGIVGAKFSGNSCVFWFRNPGGNPGSPMPEPVKTDRRMNSGPGALQTGARALLGRPDLL